MPDLNAGCELCDGSCVGADLIPLMDSRLLWLWEQVGRAADRRGDATLSDGTLQVKAAASAEERAAAAGLLGGRTLVEGQNRKVDLALLTQNVRVRGAALTPGSVAAHALRRRLATRAAASDSQRRKIEQLRAQFFQLNSAPPREYFADAEAAWAILQRTGWVTRLSNDDSSHQLLRSAFSALRKLPTTGTSLDRRRLASEITANPHALDTGSTLASLVLAVLTAGGRIKPRLLPRHAWAAVGVRCDDVVGGLIALGVVPLGWKVPRGMPVTLPPRVLSGCEWPTPPLPGAWIFVTENPSVVSAAADSQQDEQNMRLICTDGTPSDVEISAIAQLAARGWRIAVRADFDCAGLFHVASILKAVPTAVPWRMGAADYLSSLSFSKDNQIAVGDVPDTEWDTSLSRSIRQHGAAAYEESLLPLLLADLQNGYPPPPTTAGH